MLTFYVYRFALQVGPKHLVPIVLMLGNSNPMEYHQHKQSRQQDVGDQHFVPSHHRRMVQKPWRSSIQASEYQIKRMDHL